ncbi:hypothetical protein DCAR_0521865 [Daucus carota subsp. sativus]|uniref:Uncharacterized protein n=1 Tax=Daucus carota subsp. sativus TaxID=79200 RepID=A0AAF0X9U8_DAUCS|nr:hypothetical protein DCAR_0521865 [Daucus carota subsp. sativus]
MFIHFNGENSKDLPSTIPEAFQLYCGTGSLWLIRVWQSYMKGASPNDQTSFPWFVHAYISLGISFCAITCLGIFVAHTAYSHFLSCYISVMSILLFVETLMMAHLFLSLEWEKVWRFDDFKDYVELDFNDRFNACLDLGLDEPFIAKTYVQGAAKRQTSEFRSFKDS